MSNKINPSYYAIIPATVRYDKELSANIKLLYGEITVLSQKYGYCFATNTYLAELYNVHKDTISGWINILVKKNYLVSKLIYQDGTKIIKERRLYINDSPSITYTPIGENTDRGIGENTMDNNTRLEVINNSNNITISSTNNINNNIDITNKQLNLEDFKKVKKHKETISLKIEKYTTNPEVRQALYDYIEMFKEKFKSHPTLISFDKMLIDLRNLSNSSASMAVKIIENSTMREYRGFYALTKDNNPFSNQNYTLKGNSYIHDAPEGDTTPTDFVF